jgi:hypothetical protein
LTQAAQLLDSMLPDSLQAWGEESWQHADLCALSAAVQFGLSNDERALQFVDQALAAEDATDRPVDKNLSDFRCALWRTVADKLFRLKRLDEASQAIAIGQAIVVRNDLKAPVRAPLEIVNARIIEAASGSAEALSLLTMFRKSIDLPENSQVAATVDAAIAEIESRSDE